MYPKIGTNPKPNVALSRLKDLFNGIKEKLESAKDKKADDYSWKTVEDEAKKWQKTPGFAKPDGKGGESAGSVKGPGTGTESAGSSKGPGACPLNKDGKVNRYEWSRDKDEKTGNYDLYVKITGASDANGPLNGKYVVVVEWRDVAGKGSGPTRITMNFKNGNSTGVNKGETVFTWYYIATATYPRVTSVSILGLAPNAGTSKGPGTGVGSAGSAKGP